MSNYDIVNLDFYDYTKVITATGYKQQFKLMLLAKINCQAERIRLKNQIIKPQNRTY